jgi:hypothetical protein
MSCCGSSRQSWSGLPLTGGADHFAASPGAVDWEYRGATSMTVTGPITGVTYRFPYAGSRIRVDRRDSVYFHGVPHLAQVR